MAAVPLYFSFLSLFALSLARRISFKSFRWQNTLYPAGL
jgi:hypothetical protein